LSEASAHAEETPGQKGQRLHPMGLFIGFITGIPQLIFPMLAAVFGTGGKDNPAFIPFIILAVLLISLFFRWLSWLRFRFFLDSDDIRIEQGILNRSIRSIPYARIQDVRIEKGPLARILGLAEVKFETGGGKGEDAKLSFVSRPDADMLRETVKARKNSAGIAIAEEVAEEQPHVFAMDIKRLLILGLYSFSLIIFALLGGAAQQFDFLLPFDLWDFKHWIAMAEKRGVTLDGISISARIVWALVAVLALIILGVTSGIIRTFLANYSFRLDRNEQGFRRRRGLLTKTDVVLPVNRIQAAKIITGPIRKRHGWHALQFVSLAQDSKEESDHMAVPLAQLREIWPIMEEAGITSPEANAVFRKGRFFWWLPVPIALLLLMTLAISAALFFSQLAFSKLIWFFVMPLALLLLCWLDWRHYGDRIDDAQLYVRENWWNQCLTIAPQLKVQSVEIRQGPIARLMGLSRLHFGIAGGTLSFCALPLDQAWKIRDQVMVQITSVDFSEINRAD
jgi:putative membrane protein